MRSFTAFVFLLLLLLQSSTAEDREQLIARAIRENRPKICERAKESCYTSDFETVCRSPEDNRFLCYRDYAFAKNDSSICEQIRGESGSGHSYRDECVEYYAREKKDLGTCEKLHDKDHNNRLLYAGCVESVQDLRGFYELAECLKIKDLDEPYDFAKCIAGVAKQTNDLSLCSRLFSESKLVDGWGDTLLQRCLKQAEFPK
jgi:hypothetical protein